MGVRWVFPSGTVVELGEMGIKVQVFMVGEMKVLVRFMLLGGFNERDTYCILGEVHNIG
jgi:hypothetical protein